MERWLSRIGRHEVLRGAEEVRAFLVVEEEEGKVSFGAGREEEES